MAQNNQPTMAEHYIVPQSEEMKNLFKTENLIVSTQKYIQLHLKRFLIITTIDLVKLLRKQ